MTVNTLTSNRNNQVILPRSNILIEIGEENFVNDESNNDIDKLIMKLPKTKKFEPGHSNEPIAI